MAWPLVKLVWQRFPGPADQRNVLMALADFARNDDGTSCYPAVETIGRKAGCSHNTTRRLLAELAEGGFITMAMQRGATTQYIINVDRLTHTKSGGTTHTKSGGGTPTRTDAETPTKSDADPYQIDHVTPTKSGRQASKNYPLSKETSKSESQEQFQEPHPLPENFDFFNEGNVEWLNKRLNDPSITEAAIGNTETFVYLATESFKAYFQANRRVSDDWNAEWRKWIVRDLQTALQQQRRRGQGGGTEQRRATV